MKSVDQYPVDAPTPDPTDFQVAFDLPDEIFAIQDDQREERCVLSPEWCILDGDRYFVRGILPIPVSGCPHPYCFGVWAEISRGHAVKMIALWRVEPPPVIVFAGRLANRLAEMPSTRGLPVRIQLTGGGVRPTFAVQSHSHPLYAMQSRGVTAREAFDFNYAVGWTGPVKDSPAPVN